MPTQGPGSVKIQILSGYAGPEMGARCPPPPPPHELRSRVGRVEHVPPNQKVGWDGMSYGPPNFELADALTASAGFSMQSLME